MKKSLGAKAIVYPAPAFVVGTYDRQGKPNVMTVAWGGMCSSKPPCIAISLRKERYSYRNILERRAFTINIPSENYVKEADYFGIFSGRDRDKFSAAGLKPVRGEFVDAPYVEEFPCIIECKLVKTVEIGLHTQFIGEIVDVKADASVLGEDGNPDITKLKPVIYVPETRIYHGIGSFLGKAFSLGSGLEN